MHKYLFDSGRKDVSQRRQDASSRREVVFQVPKRRKKAATSRLSLVSILTSPRLNSPEGQNDTSKIDLVVSSTEFYSRPKSLLEQQYEQKMQAFERSNEAFVPMDSSFEPESCTTEESNKPNEDVIYLQADIPELKSNPKVTPESATTFLSQDYVQMGLLLQMSDRFIGEAYNCVFGTVDSKGIELYYSLMKLALTCLHMLLDKYSEKLDPRLELATHYKLARIYFYETENLESAEKFVSLSLALATRHNLHEQLIANDLLHYNILKSHRPSLLLRFMDSRISFYSSNNMGGVCDLFLLLKAQSYLSKKASLALSQLQLLNLREDVEPTVIILSLLLEASLQIYHGNALQAKALLKRSSNKNSTISYPFQLRGLHLLLSLYFYIQVGDYQKGKDASKELSKFITRQRRKEWRGWNKGGSISFQISILENSSFNYQIRWRSSEEFVIEFYLLSGVLFLTTEANFEKASETFQKCLHSIEELLVILNSADKQSFRFSMCQHSETIIRLNYIRYLTLYYQIWLDIVNMNDYLRIEFVQEFLNNLNGETFSDLELSSYCLLEDLYMYLNALYHMAHGDISAAKFLLLRVRKNTSALKQGAHDSLRAFNQMEAGIGCEVLLGKGNNSQLYLYSTLHLSLICEFELSICGQDSKNTENSLVSSCRSLLSKLSSDLGSALLSDINCGVSFSDKLLRLTIRTFSSLLSFRHLHRISPELLANPEQTHKMSLPVILNALELFIKFHTSSNLSEKQHLLNSLQAISSKEPLVKFVQDLTSKNSQIGISARVDLSISNGSTQTNFFDEHKDKIGLAHRSFQS